MQIKLESGNYLSKIHDYYLNIDINDGYHIQVKEILTGEHKGKCIAYIPLTDDSELPPTKGNSVEECLQKMITNLETR